MVKEVGRVVVMEDAVTVDVEEEMVDVVLVVERVVAGGEDGGKVEGVAVVDGGDGGGDTLVER